MKKFLAILIVFAMTLSLCIGASADIVEGKLNIVVEGGNGQIEAKPGEEVEIIVRLVNNEALSSLKMSLCYAEGLSVATKSSGNPNVKFLIAADDENSNIVSAALDSPEIRKLVLSWTSDDSQASGDTLFAKVVFKVSRDAVPGTFLPIQGEVGAEEVFDADMENIEFNVVDGGISVIALDPGETLPEETEPEETEPEEPEPVGPLNIVIDSLTGESAPCPGDEIDLKISLVNNKAISALKITLHYDDDLSVVLDKKNKPVVQFYINATEEDAGVMSGSTLYADNNMLIVNWIASNGEAKGDTVFATVKFKISDAIEGGKFLSVIADIDPDDVFDYDMNSIDFSATDGVIYASHDIADGYENDSDNHWKTCNKCDRSIDVAAHTLGEETVITDPDCTNKGSAQKVCTVCGYVHQYDLEKIDHTLTGWQSNGTEHWKECTECHAKFETAGHTLGEETIITPATCTEKGAAQKVCTVCGYVHQYDIEPNGHSLTDWKSDETNHWKECTECEDKIDTAAHTYGDETVITPATCTEKGTAQKVCTVCGYVHQYDIEPNGHSLTDWKSDETNHWKECTECHAKFETSGHTLGEETIVTPATCTEKGTAQKVCTVCGYVHQYDLEKIDHTLTVWQSNGTEHWKECTECHAKFETSGHTLGEETIVTPATCTEKGTAQKVCTVCGYVHQYDLEKTDHTLTGWQSNGTEHWKECTECHAKFETSGHTLGEETIVTPANCTEKGTAQKVCTVCGYVHQYDLEKIDHTMTGWQSNGTEHWKECTECHAKFETSGHTLGEETVIIPATCTEKGTAQKACTVCGYVHQYDLEKTDHTLTGWQSNGTEHWKECTECHAKFETSGHTLGEETIVTPATCTEKGTAQKVCTVCGYVHQYDIEPAGHVAGQLQHDETHHWHVCTECGEKIDQEEHVYENGSNICSVCGFKKFLKGDTNNDGKLNNKDVVTLFRYISTNQTGADMDVYDFNGDGKLNNKDVVALFRFISAPKT